MGEVTIRIAGIEYLEQILFLAQHDITSCIKWGSIMMVQLGISAILGNLDVDN